MPSGSSDDDFFDNHLGNKKTPQLQSCGVLRCIS